MPKVTIALPAYQAEATLAMTVAAIPDGVADELILVDDGSTDRTVVVSRGLGIATYVHERNRGYGGNQKTCYLRALELETDIVVMVHPDYQYTPLLVPAMASIHRSGLIISSSEWWWITFRSAVITLRPASLTCRQKSRS